MKALLGGKGANLAEMSSLGLPVPPGCTITTEVCAYFYKNDNRYPDDLEQQVNKALATIEDLVGATSGDARNPDRKSTRRTPVTNGQLVCRLLLKEKKTRTRQKNPQERHST